MVVRYKGETTGMKALPGGGPQGTLLGLLLFLILINDCGFDDQDKPIGQTITSQKKKFSSPTFHSKYVDDLTIAEAINLKETLLPNTERALPDPYHARLGQKLCPEKSKMYEQIGKIQEYASENQMKLNTAKCKFMLFNPTINYDFIPELEIDGRELDTMEEMKMLGLVLSNDLSWRPNTDNMVMKAYKRIWMIKRLKSRGANLDDLTDIYTKQIRSVLEFGVPVWNCGLTKAEVTDIERVQKSFLHIALGDSYGDYDNALSISKLETLEERRKNLCIKFAKKAAKHPKHKDWFVPESKPNTRSEKTNFKAPTGRLKRFLKSPIPYLTNLLNMEA